MLWLIIMILGIKPFMVPELEDWTTIYIFKGLHRFSLIGTFFRGRSIQGGHWIRKLIAAILCVMMVTTIILIEEQKQALQNRWEEMKAEREQHREEMQAWFEEQGIDHEALRQYGGFGRHGFGKRPCFGK